ncbi:hypothetical protein PspLS_01183 [Pyricularia sp. CBS 133598]|nr:hypothetical protein PspLS_01183 [Pyricularia sp. CBS 133598]
MDFQRRTFGNPIKDEQRIVLRRLVKAEIPGTRLEVKDRSLHLQEPSQATQACTELHAWTKHDGIGTNITVPPATLLADDATFSNWVATAVTAGQYQK